MADSVTYEDFRTIETGTVEWSKLKSYLQDLEDVIKDHKREIEALSKHWSGSISFAVDAPGAHTILKGGKHLRAKITNAFVTLGDNAQEAATAQLEGVSDTVRFLESEKAGKVRIFRLLRDQLHFIENLRVITDTSRKMVITLTLESAEES